MLLSTMEKINTLYNYGDITEREYKKQRKEILKNSKGKKKKKSGFSSWSGLGKFMWIILNIYTCGIPAIIYACTR